jgi:hypothetical protein
MKAFVRILSIAGLGLGFAFAAGAATVRSDIGLQGDVMGCKSCDKDKKEGDGKEAPKPQSLLTGGVQSVVMHCGHCGKDKKECPQDGDKKDGEKKEGDKKTSSMSSPGGFDKDKQAADDEKKDEGCPSGGCGKKKQN